MNNQIQESLLTLQKNTENAVLGAMVIEPGCIKDVVYGLKPEYFYIEDNRTVYCVIRDMYIAGKAIDMVTIVNELMTVNPTTKDRTVNWPLLVASLTETVVTSVHIHYHAAILADLYNRRHLNEVLSKASNDLSSPVNDYESIIEDLSKSIDGIHGIGTLQRGMSSVAEELRELIRKQEAGEDTGIRTDFDVFDSEGGLHPGSTVVVGAYPGIGKSAFATALATNIASNNVPTGFISLEMPSREIVGRMVATELYHQSIYAATPKLNVVQILRNKERRAPFETQALLDALSRIEQLPIYYEEKSSTLSEIASSIRDMVYTKHVKVVVVDFLQKILADKGSRTTREELLTSATSLLKTLAKQYDICIVELSQLTPDSSNKSDRTPHYWDLKGAQGIYENADMVVLINRPEKEGDDTLRYQGKFAGKTIKGTAELIVSKCRNGNGNTSYLVGFDAQSTTFYSRNIDTIENCY